MRSFWISVLLVTVAPAFFAQSQQGESPTKTNVLPPSPTSSSLGKYGDVPVSLYTGTPQINIPLYELKERGMTLPVSLSYHAGGLKVEETSSWVGAGWSLNAGGVITRSVRGLPDEQDHGYSGFLKIGDKVEKFFNNQLTAPERLELEKNAADGIWDTEPDMFFFNFNGRSGKIILDKNGSPSIIPNQKLRIEGDILQGFTITTEDGTQYAFGEVETTQRIDNCDIQEVLPFTSSWYLTSITYNEGTMITFGYAHGVTYQNVLPSENYYNSIFSGGPSCGGMGLQTSCAANLRIDTKRLSSIMTTGLGRIDFISTTQRTDLPLYSVDYRLDAIEIYYNNGLLKKYVLGYENGGCNRLFLKTVQERSSTNETISPYVFEYYNLSQLPCNTSKSQDHWGYYNGKPATTLVPQQFYIHPPSGNLVKLLGSDRSSDLEYAKRGTLTSIQYPTGGTTEFVYESHTYGYRMFDGAVNEPDLIPPPFPANVVATPAVPLATGTFQISTEQIVTISYSVNYSSQGIYPDNGEYVKIKNQLNSEIFARSFGNDVFYLNLVPGTYTIEVYSENADTYTGCHVDYKITGPNILKNKLCGGLRVKQIIDHDGLNELNNKTRYFEYFMDSENSRSSGVLMGEPKYDYQWTKYIHEPMGGWTEDEYPCQYIVRTSNAHVLGATQGSHVGYREVRVRTLNNGVSVNKFISPIEVADQISFGYPFALGTSYDFQRGQLIQKADYAQDISSAVTVIQKSTNTYVTSIHNRKTILGLKVGYVVKHAIPSANEYFSSIPYEHVSEWQYLSQTINESFNPSVAIPLTTAETFFYDSPLHMQLTSKVTTESNGEEVASNIFYPADYVATTDPVISKMKGAMHMQGVAIETINKRKINNVWHVIGGSFTKYTEINNGSGTSAILPYQTSNLELNNTILESTFNKSINFNGSPDARYVLENTYSYHPQKLNMVEAIPVNDYSSTYLWSYKSTLPIAEFKNTTYAQLQAAITAAGLQENTIYDGIFTDVQIRQYILSIKSFLPNKQIQGYTYKPMVGPTSITDQNNNTSFFEYDNFGRLIMSKDRNGHIVKRYQYNIKN